MSNESLRQANNVRAGAFVLSALVVGLIVLFLLGDFWNSLFGPPIQAYKATFPVVDGVDYLQSGSEVRVGGLRVGTVEEVAFEKTPDRPVEWIEVTFTLPAHMAIYSNAVASVRSGLISSDSYISFSSVGFDAANQPAADSGAPGTRLQPGDGFVGASSGGMLGSILGDGNAQHVDSMLVNLEGVTERLNSDRGMIEAVLGGTSTDQVGRIIANLDGVSSDMTVDGYVLQWMLGAPSAEEFRRTVRDLDRIVASVRRNWETAWADEVGSVLSDLESTMATVDDLVASNRAAIDSIVSDVEIIADEARTVWVPRLNDIFASGDESLREAQRLLVEINAHAPLMLGNLGDTMANLNVGSQQLNRAIAEVSASPWRLLYRPTDQEFSNELLYEAARNFAFGTADLKSATASMQRLLEIRGDRLSPEDPGLLLIRDNLVESFRRYEQAQRQLMEILRDGDSPESPSGPGS